MNNICYFCNNNNLINYYYCLNCNKIICFNCFFNNLCCNNNINFCIFYNNIIIDKINDKKYNILKNNHNNNLIKYFNNKFNNINNIIINIKYNLDNFINNLLCNNFNYDKNEIINFIDLYYDIIKWKLKYYKIYLKNNDNIDKQELKEYYEFNKYNIYNELNNLIINQYKINNDFDNKILNLNCYKKFIDDYNICKFNFNFKDLIYYCLFKYEINNFNFNDFIFYIVKAIYNFQYINKYLNLYKCYFLLINNNINDNLLKLIFNYDDVFNKNKIINDYLTYL